MCFQSVAKLARPRGVFCCMHACLRVQGRRHTCLVLCVTSHCCQHAAHTPLPLQCCLSQPLAACFARADGGAVFTHGVTVPMACALPGCVLNPVAAASAGLKTTVPEFWPLLPADFAAVRWALACGTTYASSDSGSFWIRGRVNVGPAQRTHLQLQQVLHRGNEDRGLKNLQEGSHHHRQNRSDLSRTVTKAWL